MAQTVTKDMIISDLLDMDPVIPTILMRAGMHCVTCPSSLGESLGEAAAIHGINADELVDQINDFLSF